MERGRVPTDWANIKKRPGSFSGAKTQTVDASLEGAVTKLIMLGHRAQFQRPSKGERGGEGECENAIF